MHEIPRHQCLIYEGSPAAQLPALASMIRKKLKESYRCLYLNSPPMVAGLRSYLSAEGIDVSLEIEKGSLVLSSESRHVENDLFDPDRMLTMLNAAVVEARKDGYDGLFATGDMSWEFGPKRDFSKLLEYEWRLEELFHKEPNLSGVCQYHRDTLPSHVMRQGFLAHEAIFINDTLSILNAHYVRPEGYTTDLENSAELDNNLTFICNRPAEN